MARIRTIKPEFWCDEKLSPLSAIDRLVFLGLISMADDYGRVHDNVKIIDAFVFPNTSDTVRESLANLSRIIRIKRGISSSGMPIIEIVNWDKHQRVDKPQPKLALPPIKEESQEKAVKPRKKRIPESFANDSRTSSELVAPLTTDPDLRPPTPTTDHGPSISSEPAIANSDPKPEDCKFPVFPTSGNQKTWVATNDQLSDWASCYPGVDIALEHRRAHAWVMAKLDRRKTAKGMAAFLVGWFSRQQDSGGSSVKARGSPQTFAQMRVSNTKSAIERFAANG